MAEWRLSSPIAARGTRVDAFASVATDSFAALETAADSWHSAKQFRGNQSAFNQRAAASAVSSGRVLNAMDAFDAALCTVFTTVSSNDRLFGGTAPDHHAVIGRSCQLLL